MFFKRVQVNAMLGNLCAMSIWTCICMFEIYYPKILYYYFYLYFLLQPSKDVLE